MDAPDCVVPAAGRSERMGAWKPLLPFGSSTIVQTVVERVLAACGRVVLVAGYRGEELAAVFAGTGRVTVAAHPSWEQGQLSSIRRGAMEVRTPLWFVALADMPWIGTGVFEALAARMRRGDADAVFPVHAGRRGHPVLFGPRVRDALLAGDPRGARMRDVAEGFRVRDVSWDDDSVVRDIDTMEDYR